VTTKLTEAYSNVVEKEIEWLWYPYIARGKLTIIQGDPGDGKTTLALFLASELSKEISQRENIIGLSDKVSQTIYQSAEDGIEDTVKPRLNVLGANCNNIHFINIKNVLSFNSLEIEKSIIEVKADLLILDPLQSFLGKDKSMNNISDLREVLNGLIKVAARTNCSVVLIGHMNKASNMKDLYRGLGSIDIVAVARSIMLVKRLNEDSDKRVILNLKNNLAKQGKPMSFELTEKEGFKWLGHIDGDRTSEIFLKTENKKMKSTCMLLLEVLSKGQVKATEIFQFMREKGISVRTVKEAKKHLNIETFKEQNIWIWRLADSNNNE